MATPSDDLRASASSSRGDEPETRQGRGQLPHDVFVSYSRRDKSVADAIVFRLEQAGIRCWVAPRDVIPGKVWSEAIVQAIETSRLMVVVLSGETNHSRQVLREVNHAVSNEVVVVPFRIEPVKPTGAMAYYLASEHWLDALTPPLESHISELVAVARGLLDTGSVKSPKQTPTVAPPAPPPPEPSRRRWLIVGLIAAAALAIIGTVTTLLLARDDVVPAQPAPDEPANPQEPKRVALDDLATGDCLQTPDRYARDQASQLHFWQEVPWPAEMAVVSCEEPHGGEVVFSGDVWDAEMRYPGDEAIDSEVFARLDIEFKAYVGISYDESRFEYAYAAPRRASWAEGDRHVLGTAYDPDGKDLQESIKRSGQ